MPLNSGFLSALGSAFTGYGKDRDLRMERERQAAIDAQNETFRGAQMRDMDAGNAFRTTQLANEQSRATAEQNYRTQALGVQQAQETREAAAQAEAQRLAAEHQTTITGNWGRAITGDRGAQGQVVGANASLAAAFKDNDPKDHWGATSAVDPQGVPYLVNSATGQMKPGMGTLNKGGGAMANANAQLQATRLAAATREAMQADQRMAATEADIAAGKIDIGAFNTMLGMLSNDVSAGHGIMTAGTQAMAQKLLQRNSPALYQYYSDALALAESESLVAQRPSDFRTKLGERLSAARGDPTGHNLQAIGNRRAGIVQSLVDASHRMGVPIDMNSENGKFVVNPQGSGVSAGTATAAANPLAGGQRTGLEGDPAKAEQRRAYDLAAQQLTARGQSTSILGPRP